MDPTTLLVIGVAAAAVGGGAYLFLRRKGNSRAGNETLYHFRCPGCGRRLRYQSRQVGRKGRCSHCGKDLTFPAVSQSID